MALNFDLKLDMEQKLVMTMEMQLSVKLLQMSSYELLNYINKELQENIVLESKENNKEEFEHKSLIKYLERSNLGAVEKFKDKEEEYSPLNYIEEKIGLKDYLKEQLIGIKLDDEVYKIANYIIESIDNRGYLDTDLEYISKVNNVSMDKCEEALKIMQTLEPSGIAARDLKECLKIQLDRKNINNEYLVKIIDEYLPMVSKHKYGLISKELKIPEKKVQDLVDIIKTLEPKPSRGFYTGDSTSYIIPDAIIKKVNEDFIIVMNDSYIPTLNVNHIYKDVLNNCKEKETVDYVKEKINKALFLIKSIDSRKNTLYRVIEEIIKLQKQYFLYGEEYLKPMTIKNIAEKLDLHESTVSRAIREKFIALPSGEVIKIKKLFTNALNLKNNDEQISTNSIKNKITSIINDENKKKPLSDAKICEILNKEQISISRRTVAKYREELGILSSSQRKRL